MATFTTTIPEATEEWTWNVYFDEFNQFPMRYTEINDMQTSQRAFEEAWEVSGLGPFALKAEGTPIPYDDPVQGNRTRVTHSTYALGTRQTMEAREDDRWDVMEAAVRALARSERHSLEVLGHAVLNDAFAGATYTGLDGVALCSAAHTSLKGGGTRSNLVSPFVALSHAGLEAATNIARTQTDNQGHFVPFNPTQLIVHPNNRHEAYRILESEFQPGSADNDVNTMRSSLTGMRAIDTPYLTDTGDWFLRQAMDRMGPIFFTRKAGTPGSGVDMDTGDFKFTRHYRASVVTFRWENVIGANAP